MPLELDKAQRSEAIRSIERYFQENMDERIGNIAAAALLNFFVEEIGPLIYNQAIAQAQAQLQTRVAELDMDLYEEPLAYWHKADRARKAR